MAVALAIDIGGTKVEAGIVDDVGRLLVRARRATPRGAAGEVLLAAVLDAALEARAGHDPVVCGVGCGGPMTRGGEQVSPVNIEGWRGFPLRSRLAVALGLQVHVDNDAKALARGEGWVGAAAGCSDYVALVVSTGVGGGIVLDGHLLDGAQGNAGHIGHVVVEPEGRTCGCGARGCLEAEASGTAIAAAIGAPAEAAGEAVRARTGRLVGRAVGSVANLLDLRLAVVAGSVALGYGEAFFAAAQREVDAVSQLDFSRGTTIVPAGLGADGPLVGAAAVGWDGVGHPAGPVGRR